MRTSKKKGHSLVMTIWGALLMANHTNAYPHKGRYSGSENIVNFPHREKEVFLEGAYDNQYQLSIVCLRPEEVTKEKTSFLYLLEGSIEIGPEYLSLIGYDYKRIIYFLEVNKLKWKLSEEKIICYNQKTKDSVLKYSIDDFVLKMKQATLPVRIVELIQTLFQRKHLDVG
jgi:hypothetical protein